MSEICEVGEQLSQEEISKQIEELIIALRPYNNLKASVMHNKHHGMVMVETNTELLKGENEDAEKFRQAVERWKEYSHELREGMAVVGLEPGHGYAYQDIKARTDRRMADLTFLREYYEKIKNLRERLHYKNGKDGEILWDQNIMGTIFDGEKN
jgi:hypothetical protein